MTVFSSKLAYREVALTLFIESERAPDLKVDGRPRFTFTHSFQPVKQIFFFFQADFLSSNFCVAGIVSGSGV